MSSDSLDEDGAILRALESMLARLAIRGAVVPLLCVLERGKFHDHHALNWRAFEHFLLAIRGEHFDRMPRSRCAGHRRVRFELFRIARAVALKDDVGWHVLLPSLSRLRYTKNVAQSWVARASTDSSDTVEHAGALRVRSGQASPGGRQRRQAAALHMPRPDFRG